VIKYIKDDDTRLIFQREISPKFPVKFQQVALRKLRMLNNAATLNDLRVPPANRLEKVAGNRTGRRRIRINYLWRIYFEFLGGDADQVEIEDHLH
jgi:toxin HigB-1